MIVFLRGNYVRMNPASVWVEVNGTGYEVQISLHTYSQIQHLKEGMLYTYLQIKEDAHSLFGFAEEEERNMFVLLLSVSGVGASTARMMLSSMKPDELAQAIRSNDERSLEKIKGIGAKSAKRIILELREKVMKIKPVENNLGGTHTNVENDALFALISLGISRAPAQAALEKTMKSHPDLNLEELIKQTLKSI
jgi:Holliday junction DNA helicase RuvA